MPEILTINGREVEAQQLHDWTLGLMTQGVLVKLTTARWRGNVSLTADALGLSFTDEETEAFCRKYVALGHQKLLPPEINRELSVIERRARDILESYSFTTVWGRFIPYTAFAEWDKANEEIRKEYLEAACTLGDQYDRIILALKQDYRNMAKDVWLRLYGNRNPSESFIENFTQNIANKVPSREALVESFRYEAVFYTIPLPSFLQKDLAEAREIQRQDEIREHESQLEKEAKSKIAQIYLERRKELVDGFLESTVDSLRHYVGEICDNVLRSIGQKEKKNIDLRQIKQLKKMIKKIGYLNFYDDEEVKKLLSELDFEIDKVKSERNNEAIVDKLERISKVSTEKFVPENFNPAIGYLDIE